MEPDYYANVDENIIKWKVIIDYTIGDECHSIEKKNIENKETAIEWLKAKLLNISDFDIEIDVNIEAYYD